jgi:NAD(P)-dependent dehydrogenase (short-subunit alcohol dehydrogenase family)
MADGGAMNINFDGKVAIVTGAAKGIGEAAARRLAESGASVAVLDVDEKVGRQTAASIERGEFFICDVSSAKQVETAVNGVVERFGGIDIVVSNAGIQDYGDVVGTSEELWDKVLNINLKGCFLISKYSVPHMLKRGAGAIVVVGSVQSMTAIGGSAAYVTAKHGLLGLVRAMALDYAQKGIRVNCVCPGAIDTPMLRWAANLDPNPQKVIETCDRMHAMGRIGQPNEVANAIAYLASDAASFITGAALLVDGGMLVPAGGMGFQESGTGAAKRQL